MTRRVRIAVLVMGFGGLVAEIFLLRELMIVFAGNELSIGIILANWLVLEALGCYFPGRTVEKVRNKPEAFAIITILFSIALPAAVFLTRILKNMLGISLGESVGLFPMFYSSFLILMPVSILHGALFTYSCRIYGMYATPDATSAGKVYIWETAGTVAGGVLCTFLLIPWLHSFQVVMGVAFLSFLSCLYLLAPFRHRGVYQKSLLTVLGVFFVLSGYMLVSRQADALHDHSIRLQWKDHEVVHYRNSPYGNISVLHNQGQYLFFLDGIPAIITPVPDMVFVEEFVHIPMLAHPDPTDILILRGGAGGIISEVLKHPTVRTVEYAEHDPLFLEVIREFSTPLTESELTDERVQIRYRDGRRYLTETAGKYDLIFIGVMEPANLQANRFFTREFFSHANDRLKDGGILVLGIPGSLSYVSEPLQNLNSSLYHTLKSEFSYIRVIPGDSKNLFLSSNSEDITTLDMDQLVERLDRRNIPANAMVPWHIERKLHEGWQQWFRDYTEEGSLTINRDFRPRAVFYHITHWNELYASTFGPYYSQLEKIGPGNIIPALLLPGALLFLMRFKFQSFCRPGVPYAILTSGFAGMIFSLVVIFMFQVVYGNVFSWIGLLTAFFMAGAAAGALLMNRIMVHVEKGPGRRYFLTMELIIIFFSLALPLVFYGFHAFPASQAVVFLFRILFLILSFAGGLLIGAQFPLANKLHMKDGAGLSKTAGSLYAADLLGGWLGGMAGAVALLPVLGLAGTCLTVGILKATSFALLITEPVVNSEE